MKQRVSPLPKPPTSPSRWPVRSPTLRCPPTTWGSQCWSLHVCLSSLRKRRRLASASMTPPRLPRLGSSRPQIGKHTRLLPTCQRRRVCLETGRHAGGTKGEDRALLECLADRQTDQVETPPIRARQEGGYQGRNKTALSYQIYKRSVSSRLVS